MSIEELNKHYRLQGRRHTGGTYCACVRRADWREDFLARRRLERCPCQEAAL